MAKDETGAAAQYPIPPELISFEQERLAALTRKTLAEAKEAESKAAIASLTEEREIEKRARERLHDDFDYRRYHFDQAVSGTSVDACIKALNSWDRHQPDCEIEIAISSPGGSVIDGMELFDFISGLRRRHKITTSTYGMAASMGGILLQSGTVRVCGPEAYVLIHEVSFGAGGKIGEVEDEVKFIRKVQARVLDIFANRCKEAGDAGTASKPLTRRALARGWERKDWWLTSDECLMYGLVDEVR